MSRFLTDEMNKDTDNLSTEAYHTASIVSGLVMGRKKKTKCTESLFGVILFLNAKDFILLSTTLSILFVADVPL